MQKPNFNAQLMITAIRTELTEANREARAPRTSNVFTIFRAKMCPRLSDQEIASLFAIAFGMYLEVTGHPTEWGNN
jgi:hypothetical protein